MSNTEKEKAPMSDSEFRMELTKAMGLGKYYAQPQHVLLAQVRRMYASHVRLNHVARTLGFRVPDDE